VITLKVSCKEGKIDLSQGHLWSISKNHIMNGKDCANDQLASAKRGVADARQIVERQRLRVEALRANRRDTEDAERTLNACIQALTLLEAHLRSLSKSVQ
jgi:hypothetical protein